jgi:hypothetical protein
VAVLDLLLLLLPGADDGKFSPSPSTDARDPVGDIGLFEGGAAARKGGGLSTL